MKVMAHELAVRPTPYVCVYLYMYIAMNARITDKFERIWKEVVVS
jgi:hypothetical protein